MKAKHRRLGIVLASLAVMALGATAILTAFNDSLVFFYTPSQLTQKKAEENFNPSRELRIGGLVKQGSVKNLTNGGIRFIVTDLTDDLTVTYKGLVPSLFREGQGVVAQGMLNADGTLAARIILAKHDENYMPREVVEALKASGRWDAYGPKGKR